MSITPTLVCEWCGQIWTPGQRAQRRARKPRTCSAKCCAALRIKEHGGPRAKEFSPEIVEQVRRLYYEEGLGQREIDARIGAGNSAETIMRRFNMPTRPVGGRVGALAGEKNPQWKGADAGYSALHLRVEAARGKPQQCSRCGTNDPGKHYEWANLTGGYADTDDYERMCRSCHRHYDFKRRQESGAPTMPSEATA